MNIEDMAHDMALAMQNSEPMVDMVLLAKLSFQYAEAMQAEFNKRKPQGLPEAIQDDFQVDWKNSLRQRP